MPDQLLSIRINPCTHFVLMLDGLDSQTVSQTVSLGLAVAPKSLKVPLLEQES